MLITITCTLLPRGNTNLIDVSSVYTSVKFWRVVVDISNQQHGVNFEHKLQNSEMKAKFFSYLSFRVSEGLLLLFVKTHIRSFLCLSVCLSTGISIPASSLPLTLILWNSFLDILLML